MTEKDNLLGFDQAMQELHTDPLLMSAFGAMIWYLRSVSFLLVTLYMLLTIQNIA
jgi:hypothetical protein